MEITTEMKVGIGVIAVTLVIILGGVFLSGRNAQAPGETTQTVDNPDRITEENSHTLGASDAQVTVVEFGDFECPACGALHPVLKEVKEKYKDQSVKFVYRQFPLTQIHELALNAAQASEAAADQGKFWEYHDILFEKQPALKQEDLEKYAQDLGLNIEEFRTFQNSNEAKDRVNADLADGRALGVPGTPTIFINDQKYNGQYSVSALSTVIDSQLNQ